MKKLSIAMLALLASSAVSAVEFPTSGLLRMTDCQPLLNENVQINLSTNVVAGVSCNATGIALAACHTAGRTASREVEQLIPDPDVATNPPLISQDPAVFETVEGPQVATASTFQGTVVPQYPEADACTAAVAEDAATARLTN